MLENKSVVFIEPQALNKEGLCRFLGIGPKILARMISASRHGDAWLDFVSNPRGNPRLRLTATVESARVAFRRLRNGEQPPLLPCEHRKKKERSSEIPVHL